MSEIADLIKVMQEQMQRQEERHQQQEERYQQQEERHQQQEERHRQQLTVMQQQLDEQRKSAGTFASQKQTPPFPAFDSTAELWKDYLLRFKTFLSANSVPGDKLALVFLTNQTSDTYKLINNYASQQDTPPRPITCNSVTLQNSCLSTTILPSSQSERDTSSGAA